MCLFGSRSKPETKASAFELTAESVSQPACCISYWYVARMHTSSTQGDAREGNLILNLFFFGTTTKASTVAGKREECVPCDPGYELRKGESLTKSCAKNTRGWDRKKTQAACMNVFPALFGACIDRLGAVPSNNNIP